MQTVFLDRDGVINKNIDNGYVTCWEAFEFLPNALKAIQKLTAAGYQLIIVTNQACINKGIISSRMLEAIHSRMVEQIEANDGKIRAIYHCPHRDEDGCDCRKPKPGMLIQAATEHGIDFSTAYLIGDSSRDIAAGQQVGCQTFLVLTGHGHKQIQTGTIKPGRVFDDLYATSVWICDKSRG